MGKDLVYATDLGQASLKHRFVCLQHPTSLYWIIQTYDICIYNNTKSREFSHKPPKNISQNRFSTNQPFPFRDWWIGRTHLGSDSNTTDGIVDGHAYTVITCLNDVAGTEHPGSKETSLENFFWWSGALGVKGGKTAGSFKGCQPRNEMIRTWVKDFWMFFCFEGCSMLEHHCIGGGNIILGTQIFDKQNLKGKHLSCKDQKCS